MNHAIDQGVGLQRTRFAHLMAALLLMANVSIPADEHTQAGETGAADHHSASSVHSAVTPKGQVEVGTTVPLVLTLKDKDGSPVMFDDLREIHTKKIHMLIIDPSLSDYQHVHPDAGDKPGNYQFEFIPKHGGTYYFYADLLPVKTNAQEYSLAKLKVPGPEAKLEKKENRTARVDGYRFDLNFDNPELVQGKGNKATLKITTADGQPFDKLEPLMGAFAHMVAFTEDRRHVLHVHPQGKEPEDANERGGPVLTFYVNPLSAGFQQLYAQVQIDGKNVFAPFGLNVKERKPPSTVAGIFEEVDQNVDKLNSALQLGQLDQMHGIAFWTRDVLSALPKAADVKPGTNMKLNVPLKHVKTLAEDLDHAGDAHNTQQAKTVLAQFTSEVESIRQLTGAPARKTALETADVKVLGNKNCPVSNMPVGSMEAGAAVVYKGQKIGLCCNGCRATFDKDPEAYLKKAQQSANQ